MTDRLHLAQFSLLVIIFGMGLFIYFTTTIYWIQRTDVILLALLYPVWGIWHHYEHGHLNPSITLEYILVGVIALIGFLSIL